MKPRVVHVNIHGQPYAVRSELDAQYISELAACVDEKMRLAAREIASADSVRVAVIAALNLADELYRARAAAAATPDGQVLSRAADLERLLDSVLELPQPEPKVAHG
jgi:cell division protein ZapA